MLYNMCKLDFGNNECQYRIYDTPVYIREDVLFADDVRKDRLFLKHTLNHKMTPFCDKNGERLFGDVKENFKIFSYEEMKIREARSISSATSRAKQKVYEYSRANEWDYFFTLTLSPDKVNRYDLKACSKLVRKWFNHLRERLAPELKYLIVPEQHKKEDGPNGERAWHFHALVANVGDLSLKRAENKRTGKLLFTKSGLPVFNIESYQFGWTTATPVKDSTKAANYITKYITKSLVAHSKGSKRYYISNNLNKPKRIYYLLEPKEIKRFVSKRQKKITYQKEIKITVGCYRQMVTYLEIKRRI